MAFGNLGGINIGIGVLAKPFVAAMKFIEKTTKKTMSKVRSLVKNGAKAFKTAGRATRGVDSFLSPEWFKQRARWFVQLRLFWALWQSLSSAVSGAFDFEQEMANVRAITQATNKQFEELRDKALEVGKTTRFSAAEAARGFVVMSQAGLTAKEVIDSVTAVANLAVATMSEFEETASLVVTTMRAWKKPAEDAQQITDIFATSINKTKLTLDALANGFKFISGIAPQMNVSIEETTALLGIMANRGLSASIAATSLRAFMAALINPTDKFKKVLKQVGLTLDDVDPRLHHVGTILETLRVAGFGTAEAFAAFRRRAASGAAILIGASKEFENLSQNMNETGRAAQMAAINLDTVQGQSKQLQDTLVALASDINRDMEPALKTLARLTKIFASAVSKSIKPLSELIAVGAKWVEQSVFMATRGKNFALTDEMVDTIREANNEMKTQIQTANEAINKIRELRITVSQWRTIAKEATGEVDGIVRPELLEKGLRKLRDQKLITQEQYEFLLKIESTQERRLAAEKLITKTILEREESLQIQWKLANDVIKSLQQAAIQRALPAVSPAFKDVKDALEAFKEAGAVMTDLEETEKAFGFEDFLKASGPLGGLGVAIKNFFPPKQEKAVKNLTKEFGELFRVSSVLTDDQVRSLRTLNPLIETYVLLARKSQGNLKKFLELLDKEEKQTGKKIILTKKELDRIDVLAGHTKDNTSNLRNQTEENVKAIGVSKSLVQARIKEIDTELTLLRVRKSPLERQATEEALIKEQGRLKEDLIDKEVELAFIKDENLNIELEALQVELRMLDTAKETKRLQREKLATAERLKLLQEETKEEIGRLKQKSAIGALQGLQAKDLLKIDKASLIVQKSAEQKAIALLEKSTKIVDRQEKIRKHKEKILDLDNQIALNTEKQMLAGNAIARAMVTIRNNPLNFKDTAEFLNATGGIIDTLVGAGKEGLTTGITEISNLWAEQREEAAGLEKQLDSLNTQYQEAISQGNIERARQLEQQMSNLRNRVDELNNPLENLANTFKQFALTVIQELQKVIIKMLVVKLIGMALNMFGGGGPGMGNMAFGNQGGDAFSLPFATGGLMPGGTFKNFRKFARGGVTGGAGLALLGDNASGKELVIPSENIHDDNVSGTVRDNQTPINIINVLTEQDIARAMAGTAGQRTIINTIGKDIGKRGPTYRAIKT